MRRAPLRRRSRPRRRTPLRRRTAVDRRAVAPASAAQRAAVRDRPCVVCGTCVRVDPAHLIPRALGGCDHALCVVALCRTHHRAYDAGRLDLVPYLEPRWRAQVAHAVAHVGLVAALRRLSGSRDPDAES